MDRTVFGRGGIALLLVLCLLLGAAGAFAQGVVTPSEPEEPEGWMLDGGEKIEGALEELILRLNGAEGEIFLMQRRPVRLKNIRANLLAQLTFAPDPDAFPEEGWRARVTAEKPAEGAAQEDIDLTAFAEEEDDVLVTVYVWTEKPEPEPEPTPRPVAITVAAEGFAQGEWMSAAPTFALGGIPEDGAGCSYAAILFDERMEDIEGASYTPDAEGVFTLRFVILNDEGDILSASEQYTLRMDMTPPEVSATPSETRSYALIVSASDTLSGVAGVSRDGGATWEDIAEDGTWTYKAGKAETIAAGDMQVRDAAGNIWRSEAPIELAAVRRGHGGGSGGPRKEHSSNTSGNDGRTNYIAARLTAAAEPVDGLTVREHTLSLAAVRDGAEKTAPFTAAFARWTPAEEDGRPCGAATAHTGDIAEGDDTLVLTAVPPESDDGEEPEYVWRFDGAFLRTLYSSGVDILALRLGDDIAVLPTAGFTAGTRFTELKIAGTSSRRFAYEARMERLPEAREGEERLLPEGNYTEGCLFTLTVDVDGEAYQLFPRDTEEMYAEGVLCAPMEAMERPLGAYPPEEEPAA